MVDSTVVLEGDPAFASADAAAMGARIQNLGYVGEARAVDGRIELRLPMPAGVTPDRIVARVIRPGQLKIHAEVADNANAQTLQDCTAGSTDCHPVAVGPALLTSADVAEAAMMPDLAGGGLAVRVRFTDAGAKRLEEATTNQVGQRLVIQVDDVVLSRPVVHEPIRGGEAVIHIGPAIEELQIGHASTLVARIQGPPLQADWAVTSTQLGRPRR
jgi:preprotein translocase subunit SecD